MKTNQQPLVGIIGGMGIDAGLLMVQKIRDLAEQGTEQSQPRTMLVSDPSVPDRTDFVTGRGPNPVPKLVEVANQLCGAGADVLVMACNTAHSPEIFNDVLAGSQRPFISMIRSTTNQLTPESQKIGLLATDGTLASGVYRTALQLEGKTPIVPCPEQQRVVMDCIYAIKTGGITAAIEEQLYMVFQTLAETCDSIILGCTELSLAGIADHPQAIDSTTATAQAVLAYIGSVKSPDALLALQ